MEQACSKCVKTQLGDYKLCEDCLANDVDRQIEIALKESSDEEFHSCSDDETACSGGNRTSDCTKITPCVQDALDGVRKTQESSGDKGSEVVRNMIETSEISPELSISSDRTEENIIRVDTDSDQRHQEDSASDTIIGSGETDINTKEALDGVGDAAVHVEGSVDGSATGGDLGDDHQGSCKEKSEEDVLRDLEQNMTDEEKEARKQDAGALKQEANILFRDQKYADAREIYSKALRISPLCFPRERAILYANRGACKMKMEELDEAIEDCSKAVELHPQYVKAFLRRAELYERTNKLEEALQDYQKVVELDRSIHTARAACMRLPDQIKEKNEKLKEEMIGKLKELGNMVLKPFGLSTDNFQLQQDPNTGGYSVQFNQNGS